MGFLPTEFLEDKSALRRYFRGLRDTISPACRHQMSRSMVERLCELPQYRQCKTVLLYAPIRSEADLLDLAEIASGQGKRVAFPVSNTEDFTLTFREIFAMSDLRTGAYGIREPKGDLPPVTDFSESLCLVPALAFDRFGYRLGYGKGFYDRHLAHFTGVSVGVCFGDCLCDRLPCHPHDRRVDLILTEGGALTPNEEA